MNDIGTAIRIIRVRLSLPQRELAAKVGISASYLSLIEKGRREPTLSLLRTIANELGVSPAILLAVNKDPRQQPVELRRIQKDFAKLFECLIAIE